jgi:hypothetical protein
MRSQKRTLTRTTLGHSTLKLLASRIGRDKLLLFIGTPVYDTSLKYPNWTQTQVR